MSAFPSEAGAWPGEDAEKLGFDREALQKAVAFAEANESTNWPRHMVNNQGVYDSSTGLADGPEYNELLGPVKAPRGGPNGLIIRHGFAAAQWGDTFQVDMTFSISKSYLALLALLAVQDGLIEDLHRPVRSHGLDDGFEAPQNQDISWHHLLTQTSEWEGTLWDKPDLADRNRSVGGDDSLKGSYRALQAPGKYWEYNDVRVNRLSLSLTRLWGRPLSAVLQERIMQPIGASADWEWPAYRNAVIDIDGGPVPVLPGGGHWGGGLWVHSQDHARVAWLVSNRGAWQGTQVLEPELADLLQTQAPGNPQYGYLWWLNAKRGILSAAPESSMLCRGAGSHLIWIDREHDLVTVTRWLDSNHWDSFSSLVLEALT